MVGNRYTRMVFQGACFSFEMSLLKRTKRIIMGKKNIIFDVGGVLFEAHLGETAQHKLFVPIKKGIELLHDVVRSAADEGHQLFICTNWSSHYMNILEQEHPAITRYFKALVTPTIAHAKKPDPKMLQYILDTYNLVPHASVLIDDLFENVEAAKRVSMEGIHVYQHDFDHVRRELTRFGILR